MPWRCSSRGTATVGPMPISSGEQPPTAKPLKAPRGVTPRRDASASAMSTHALAPSESCEALPGVIVAVGSTSARTALSEERPSSVVSPRLHSSPLTVASTLLTSPVSLFLTCITVSSGAISSSKSPAACAAAVRCCERSAYASCASRETP